MTLAAQSREWVETQLTALQREYGDFDRVEKSWTIPTGLYEFTRTRAERTLGDAPDADGGPVEGDALGGGAVWLAREDGAVLLARREGDDGWSGPGGNREVGESFESAARRELREETGVDCRLGDAIAVTVMDLADASDLDRPAIRDCMVVFAGEYAGGSVRPEDGEIAEVGWFESMPDDVLFPEMRDRRIPAPCGGRAVED
jgi:8-oxo-dGTP diphosphatase